MSDEDEKPPRRPRLAWALTGSGHDFVECLDFMRALGEMDVFLSRAAAEVIFMYTKDRDPFPPGAFDDVKKQVFDGVIETACASHACGLTRVQETVKAAIQVPLAQTDYTPYVQPGDRKGLCHHLANDDKLKWVKP